MDGKLFSLFIFELFRYGSSWLWIYFAAMLSLLVLLFFLFLLRDSFFPSSTCDNNDELFFQTFAGNVRIGTEKTSHFLLRCSHSRSFCSDFLWCSSSCGSYLKNPQLQEKVLRKHINSFRFSLETKWNNVTYNKANNSISIHVGLPPHVPLALDKNQPSTLSVSFYWHLNSVWACILAIFLDLFKMFAK